MPFNQTDIIVGLRNDNNEQFGKHTTGHISLGYTLKPKTRLIIIL